MSVTAKMFANYPHAACHAAAGDFVAASQLKCALFTSAAAPTQAMTTITNVRVTCTEVAQAGNYTTGGVVCAAPTCAYASLITTLDCDDPAWTSATITARYAVYYEVSTGVGICYVDFGADYTSTNGTYTIQQSASGIATITVA